MRWLLLLLTLLASDAVASTRATVDASAPSAVAVTVYRDPNRSVDQPMSREWPRGFAMISETRTVALPPGESTIRFEGVAEGLVAVSAIVTGLPGGTIEKNRNADLLSPAALVDGTLGNRVRITRTDPATGAERSESAIVRTRADGGLVLQTEAGFEAVRCSGLPEKLTFDRVPAGLSALPVFTLDTRDPTGGTYTVTLTYLAWGFDWQAHYVATLGEQGRSGARQMALLSWLTLVNDNGQSFPDAQLLAVAGKLNVESDYQALSDPPQAAPLRLTCYPIGSTSAGTGLPFAPPPPPPPPSAPPMVDQQIIVTGARAEGRMLAAAAPAMMASEEELGDLKLYRVPESVTVAAKQVKQIVFLDREEVKGTMMYRASCSPGDEDVAPVPAAMRFETVNDTRHGLGVALPQGGLTIFEPSDRGDLLVGEERLRDHASGQDIVIEMGESSAVFARCETLSQNDERRQVTKRMTLANANREAVMVQVVLGRGGEWTLRGVRRLRLKDGEHAIDVPVPGTGRRVVEWQARAD